MLIRLIWLSLGMFAIGTEGLMIAGILPVISTDLNVTLAGAGQLVTVFALVYAFSAPVTATLLAGMERRRVLIVSLIVFMAANLLAAASTSYSALMAARVLGAISAGLYSPTASAFAGSSVEPHHRGRALAFVVGGVSVSVALGAPLGTLVGTLFGWRFTFLAVSGLTGLALLGIVLRLPSQAASARVSLGDRIRTAGKRDVGFALLSTLLWGMGGFTVYTYTAALLAAVADWHGVLLSVVLLAFGLGAVTGTTLGGIAADRYSPWRLQMGVLAVLAAVGVALSLVPMVMATGWAAGASTAALFALWGVAGWMFHPAQQVRLMGMAPNAVPVVLSLNQSAMYLGMAAGGIAGGLTLKMGTPMQLGWVSAACQLAALVPLLLSLRRMSLPAAQTGLPKMAPESSPGL